LLKKYKVPTNIGVGSGFVLLTLGNYAIRTGSFGGPVLGLIVELIGAPLFVWGCCQYARGKGYSPFWGALGLLYLVGLLVLVLMPDRHKTGA
jgi:hypothetical protein